MIPRELDELISRKYPDCLDVEARHHSDRCYTLTILDLDYRYQVWRANLSVDDRWSLAPVDVTPDTFSVDGEQESLM